MSGKRKRYEAAGVETQTSASKTAPSKPISAIAAARARAQAKFPAVTDGAEVLVRSASPGYVISEEEENVPEQEVPIVQHNVRTCSWQYEERNIVSESEDQITIALNKNSTITLIGCYDFAVLKGAININGANFGASRPDRTPPVRRAFAPSTHPIATIRGLDRKNEVHFLSCDEPTPFSEISPLYRDIWNAKSANQIRSFSIITESDADALKRPIAPELTPEDWQQQIEECATSSKVTLISGEPSSGKSTFARKLLNRYLTGFGKNAPALSAVFYLDLDPANAEYSPDGQLSLLQVKQVNLGPSFTHPAPTPKSQSKDQLIRSHPMPIRNIPDYQGYYLACVEDLYQAYINHKQQQPSNPLIINTPDWFYATGSDVLHAIFVRLKPQRLVYLGHALYEEEGLQPVSNPLKTAATKARIPVYRISAQTSPNPRSRTASELRAMQMLSYFHGTGFGKPEPGERAYSPQPLSFMKPWEFCYEETAESHQSFIGFLGLCEWIEPPQLITALNGAIVQIVETSDVNVQQRLGHLPRTKRLRIPFFDKSGRGLVEPLNPATSRLVCTALIRGWDPERRIVQVIVPKTHESLMHGLEPEKTVFLFGCCEHPDWAYTEDAYYDLSRSVKERGIDERLAIESVALPPWTATADTVEGMGYLYTTRRTRKFQQ